MDLEELRAFVAVVETGSFLAAERQLRMPRATVRRRVDALEARAGVPLLRRTRQGLGVTEAGEVLAVRGRQMIQEASALVASIREVGREPAGVLRVLLPIGLPPHLLVPMFRLMRGAYPKLAVHVRFSADPLGGLLDDVDVAVHFGARSPPGPWVVHELITVPEHLIAHVDYLARHGAPERLDDLASHPLFSWAAPGEDPRVWSLRAGGTVPVDPALITADIHFVRQCVIAGLGLALLPDALVPDPGVAPDAMVPVMPDIVGRARPLRLVVPRVLADVPKIRALLRHVQEFTATMR